MTDTPAPTPACDDPCMLANHAIIAGFGIPGRAVAERLDAAGVAYCVVELNRTTVERCARGGVHIIEGDVAEEATLRRAGVERAAFLALTVPSDPAVLAGVTAARRLNPKVRILARCRYVSTALEAHRRGADDTVSEEQVVAEAFGRQTELLVSSTVNDGLPAR